MSEVELLPCPFCGAEPILVDEEDNPDYPMAYCYCSNNNCGIGFSTNGTIEEVVVWNVLHCRWCKAPLPPGVSFDDGTHVVGSCLHLRARRLRGDDESTRGRIEEEE